MEYNSTRLSWTEEDWRALLLAIRHKQCTPFLGAGACHGVLPLGRELAQDLAKEWGYPFPDTNNLVRVAQYVSVRQGALTPKLKIKEAFSGKGPPNFSDPTEPHRVLAELELPVYITTNYDDFMVRAIQTVWGNAKRPRQEHCRWYEIGRKSTRGPAAEPLTEATPDEPVVFHLHGVLDRQQSMVLTEDDYLNFLMYVSEIQDLIPARITEAFADSALLFMGYSLEDMDFKVLFRRLAPYIQANDGAKHVSVQLPPSRPGQPTEEDLLRAEEQQRYLEEQFKVQKVKVYWGTCREFLVELKRRREAMP